MMSTLGGDTLSTTIDPPDAPAIPPLCVLEAFGASGSPVVLPGGRGTAWRAGPVVLKPLDIQPEMLVWYADGLGSVAHDGFRLPVPLRAQDGRLVVDGWCAWPAIAGRHEAGRWREVIATGERLHREFAALARPSFLDSRSDAWAVADRVAWGEAPLEPYREFPHVARLASAREPLAAPCQLVHGDLTGNVLFAVGLPPGILDVSPYWRPVPYASAIVAVDAIAWEGAEPDLIVAVDAGHDVRQFLIRAVLARLIADLTVDPAHADPVRVDAAYAPIVTLACGDGA